MAELIVIEGTDCSGKETQSNLLIERLRNEGRKIEKLGFPAYDTPTGKICGGAYLGKKHICEGFFPEGAVNVNPKVAALYYAADRKYNAERIISLLQNGTDVLLDRYVESNMGHQGGKLATSSERLAMYKWLEKLEYELLELPRPTKTIFLHMPYQCAVELKKNRAEPVDQHEADPEHLINSENAYLELATLYNFTVISCAKDGKARSIQEIHEEIVDIMLN